MLSINSNTSNSVVERGLYSSSKTLQTSLQRLSSGMRINNAGDDSAGLALSTKINSEVRSLSQAKLNTQTGLNYLQIGSGSLSNMLTVMQRVRDLAVQSANGVYSSQERNSMQQEVNELQKELGQIQDTTKFSDKNIFGESSKFIQKVDQISEDEAKNLGYVTISSAEEFIDKIADNGANTSGKTFILTNDIDMSGISSYSSKYDFAGTLDGNGYAIKNLTSARGLFSYTNAGSTVKNLGIENININITSDGATIGALIGSSKSTVRNCYSTGNLINSNTYGPNAEGGLIGSQNNANVENCYSTVNVQGQGAGGLIGNIFDSSVKNCYAKGNVAGNYGGGLIGGGSGSGNIENSYATGNVSTTNDAGGLVGHTWSAITIRNCYATGNVYSNPALGYGYAGGIIGDNQGMVENCYATGKVESTLSGRTGGIAGQSKAGYTVSGCVWNKETTGQSQVENPGGPQPNNQGLTTQEMSNAANYSGWDQTTWDFSNGIPQLKVFSESAAKNNSKLTLQIDGKNKESSNIEIDTSFALGKVSFNISTADSARNAIKQIDEIIEKITSSQSSFGANINILESILSSQDLKTENLSAAYSTITDTDIAKEGASLTKNQILQNTGASLLSQSSQVSASIILALLNKK